MQSTASMLKTMGVEARKINVWLRYETHQTTFWCPFCRNGVFKTHQRIIAVIYGEGVLEPFLTAPVSVECKHCGTVFAIQGINE